ncbi:hypothetical protein CGRA01v4_11437 [Colletotrichum graminicola]|nr:hypothetical protein CGRA01v4_11437 [Colletotrichum graminicola]
MTYIHPYIHSIHLPRLPLPPRSLPCPNCYAVSGHFTFSHADLERTVSHRPTSYLIQRWSVPVPSPSLLCFGSISTIHTIATPTARAIITMNPHPTALHNAAEHRATSGFCPRHEPTHAALFF